MQKPKGIVMQVSDSHAIVMTADRQFLRVPVQPGMTIGQEIEFQKKRSGHTWRKVGLLAASLTMAVGLWQATEMFLPEKASAYVALDINPSLELSIDHDKEVISVITYNKDGEVLVNNLKLKGKLVNQAVQDVTAEAIKQGFVKPEGDILVTATESDKKDLDISALEQEVMKSVGTYLQQAGINSHVGGVLVSDKEREEAKSMGLSPGKYALYKQAEVSNLQITVDDVKQQSVSNLANEHGQEVKELVSGMNGNKKLEDLLQELHQKQGSSTSEKNNNGNHNGQGQGQGQNGKSKEKNSNGNGQTDWNQSHGNGKKDAEDGDRSWKNNDQNNGKSVKQRD